MFRRIFIANRGEVAVRVARACDALGIEPVFGVSEADRDAPWVSDRAFVCLGPARSSLSYLNAEALIQAARQTRCSALHPGWGFLSENPEFATLCETHGITFIGPPAHVMARMGTKIPAKQTMAAAGLSVIDGSPGVLRDVQEARDLGDAIGYPIVLKAQSGGGGRGMRIASRSEDVPSAYEEASAEARSAFGDPRLYLERLIQHGRHIELQIIADRWGNVVHLGERDCTVQRNHQKLIEESPSPVLPEEERTRTFKAATEAVRALGYVGAGTLEFLLDDDGVLRFMEMNTRLQVEHSVTEMRTGLDLVQEQIRIAAGHRLSWTQDEVSFDGHVIECRINAEDPSQAFRPSPGTITHWQPPEGPAIRVDTHVQPHYVVPPHYDSLLAKVIVKAPHREAAIAQMLSALEAFDVRGIQTTIPMHQTILRSDAFAQHRYDIRTIPGWPSSSQR